MDRMSFNDRKITMINDVVVGVGVVVVVVVSVVVVVVSVVAVVVDTGADVGVLRSANSVKQSAEDLKSEKKRLSASRVPGSRMTFKVDRSQLLLVSLVASFLLALLLDSVVGDIVVICG